MQILSESKELTLAELLKDNICFPLPLYVFNTEMDDRDLRKKRNKHKQALRINANICILNSL